MAFDLATVLVGSGSGFLGFIGGAIQSGMSAEGRYSKRVDGRLRELEEMVRKCEEERPQIAILKMGVLMLVTEFQSKDRKNPVLKQVAAAFAALPQTDGSFDELIRKLNDLPGSSERPQERGE